MIERNRKGEMEWLQTRYTEKGSDLEVADRKKITLLGALVMCRSLQPKETVRKTEEQTGRQTVWSLSSFSLFPLSLSLCVFICTPL